MQVNFLSNALLALLLLPLLQKTPSPAPSSALHTPTITFVGSMGHAFHSLANFPLHTTTAIIPYYDDPHRYSRFSRYADTKFFVALFVRALTERIPLRPLSSGAEAGMGNVIVNNVCPGTVNTAADDKLPWYLRIPMNLHRRIRARTVPEGARALVHAAVVAGRESHGGYISNNEIKS